MEDRFDARLCLPKIYGITAHGVALSSMPDLLPRGYQRSRVSESRIVHDLLMQDLRTAADAAGWKSWVPARALMTAGNKDRPHKIPDAIAVDAKGRHIAIELERTIKTPKDYRKLMRAFHANFEGGRHYGWALYVSPDGLQGRIARAFDRAKVFVTSDNTSTFGRHIYLAQDEGREFRARFSFVDLDRYSLQIVEQARTDALPPRAELCEACRHYASPWGDGCFNHAQVDPDDGSLWW